MFSSPPRSSTLHSRNTSTIRKKPPPSTKSQKNKARKRLEEAISKANLPKSANQENERTFQNPNNAIFIDKHNERVYKIGLWQDRDRCIRNEFIAYTLLLTKDMPGRNIRYPEMFDCQKIADTKYAKITLKYIPNIQMVCFTSENNSIMNNGNNESSTCSDSLNNEIRNNLIQDARQYLEYVAITHNDERENLFFHTKDNQLTFLWMDFEAATFDKEQLNMCSKLLLQNNVQIRNTNNEMSTIGMSSSKKRVNPFTDWRNNNNNN